MYAETQTSLDLARQARSRGDRTASLEHFRAAVTTNPAEISLKVEVASDLRALGRLDEAEAELQKIIEQKPQHVGALIELGHLARKRNDRAASLSYFRAAAAADPNNLLLKADVASDLRELGRLDEAEAELQKILNRDPDHFPALFSLGQIAIQNGNRTTAIAHLVAASHAASPNLDARLSLAAAFRELSQFNEAEEICRQVVTNPPNRSKALTELGRISRTRADRAQALALFRSAAAANSSDIYAKLELVTELRDRGLYDEAKSILDAALQLEPGNVHTKMQCGYFHRHTGDRGAARTIFCDISQNHPDFLQALVEVAIEERALGNPGKAEKILEQVVATKPNHLPALGQLAECARLTGDLEQCLSIYQRALELYPGQIWLYIHTSQTLSDCGEHTAAHTLLDTATSIFGERPEISCKRAELLKRAGLLPDARQAVEAAFRDNPHSFPLWSHCVQFDILLGDYAAAAARLKAFSSEIVSELSAGHVFRGQLAEAQHQFDEARDHYRAALALNPHDGWARAEMFRICMLLLRVDEAHNHLVAWTRLNKPAAVARGQSMNVSQSHMGQVYGEFALNRDLIEQLVQIRALAPENRIAPLRSLLRQNADHSPSAIQLIVAMRQAKLLNVPPPGTDRSSSTSIPKVIIQYWDDPEPPEDVTRLMETWRSLNPEYVHQRFNDADAQAFLSQHYEPSVLRAYRRAENPAEKADLFRLAYLYVLGGVYVDADDRCLAPIGSVLPPHVSLAVYQEDYALGGLAVGTLGNNFLAAAPHNAVIGRALELATEALNRGDTDIVWLKTGPALISRAFAEIAAKTPLKLSSWLIDIAVLERSQLSRFSAIHCFTAYKRTTRHWSNTVNPTRTVAARA
jgi:tetratricopeptide (TPR) repeat protein